MIFFIFAVSSGVWIPGGKTPFFRMSSINRNSLSSFVKWKKRHRFRCNLLSPILSSQICLYFFLCILFPQFPFCLDDSYVNCNFWVSICFHSSCFESFLFSPPVICTFLWAVVPMLTVKGEEGRMKNQEKKRENEIEAQGTHTIHASCPENGRHMEL